jgi:ubiquitin-protein ligase
MDLLRWECIIPGPDKTDWAGGFYPMTMEFSEDYPVKPPKVFCWLVVDSAVRTTLLQNLATDVRS